MKTRFWEATTAPFQQIYDNKNITDFITNITYITLHAGAWHATIWLIPMGLPVTDTARNRAQLARILGSRTFHRAEAQGRLLGLLTRLTMEQAWEALRQKALSAELFGHHSDASALVGTTANRLRRTLAKYYLDEGRRDTDVFRLSPRGYIIESESASSPKVQSASWNDSQKASRFDFAAFVELVLDLTDLAPEDLNHRVREWISSTAKFQGLKLTPNSEFQEFVRYITKTEQLLFSDMKSLARELGIHPLMLDPLRSRLVKSACLLLDSDIFEPADSALNLPSWCEHARFVPVPVSFDESSYGHRAQYFFPEAKIAETDTTLVWVQLGPSGHSDAHVHLGDELLVVLRGNVEVRFRETGIRVELSEGDFTHFYAEQTHSAHNLLSEPAALLIVRFGQRVAPRARNQIVREVRRNLSLANPEQSEPGTELSLPARSWILEASANRPTNLRDTDSVIPTDIRNRPGLARLLRKLAPPQDYEARVFLDQWEARTGARCESIDHWLWGLEAGRIRMPADLVPSVAQLYGVFEPLICNFLFPGALGQVVVKRGIDPKARGSQHSGIRGDWAPLYQIAEKLKASPPPDAVTYEIPIRSLAFCDVSIAWLTLGSGKVTKANRHPGFELLIPIKGEITLEYADGSGEAVLIGVGRFAYFNSEEPHVVSNKSDNVAELLILRVLEEKFNNKTRDQSYGRWDND